MDPDTSGAFYDRLEQVVEGVALDEGARMPGQGKRESDPVEVPDTLWAQVAELAG